MAIINPFGTIDIQDLYFRYGSQKTGRLRPRISEAEPQKFDNPLAGRLGSMMAASPTSLESFSSLLGELDGGESGGDMGELFKTLLFLQGKGRGGGGQDDPLSRLFSGIQL